MKPKTLNWSNITAYINSLIAAGGANIASAIHGASAKTTPVDNDEFALVDSAASYGLKKTLWSSVKATLKTYFDGIYVAITYLQNIYNIQKEPTGFTSPGDVIVTYDSTTQKITLTGTVAAYYKGVLVSALTSGWVSSAHTNTTGHIYILYYNGTDFLWSTDTFPGFDQLLIAIVYYRASNPFAVREPHGLQPWQCHLSDHYNLGTYRLSGGDITNIVTNSTTADNRRPIISACTIMDEDLPTTNASLTTKLYTQRYMTLTNTINYTLDAADIVSLSGNNPYYNEWNGSAFVQTLMPANSVQTIWLYEVPVTADTESQAIRHVFVQGQSITQAQGPAAGQLTTAINIEKSKNTVDLNLGDPAVVSAEYVCIKKFIIVYTASNWYVAEVVTLTGNRANQTGTPSGSYLSSVSASAPILGTGTAGDPLYISGALTNITTMSMSGQLTNTVSTGTAPFVVSSATKVNNLNVDLLDGYSTGASGVPNTIPYRDSNGSISNGVSEYSGLIGASTSAFGVSGSSTDTYGIYGYSEKSHGIVGYTGDASGYGVYGNGEETTSIGVYGNSSGASGVRGVSSSSHGVYGTSTTGYGVSGYSPVRGVSGTSLTGYGVYGYSEDVAGVYGLSSKYHGIYGTSTNVASSGVYGYNSSGYGVTGTSSSGYGVNGSSTTSKGVVGTSRDDNGLYGSSTNGTGIYGTGGATAIEGYSLSGVGVKGSSSSSYGVYGASASNYAGYFSGTLYTSGAITAPTSTNTINGLIINSGALSGITTLNMSGNLTVDTNTLFVDTTNNVIGIGTSTPLTMSKLNVFGGTLAVLDIVGDNYEGIFIGKDSNNGYITVSKGGTGTFRKLALYTSETERLTILPNGYVGINKTIPDYPFEVVGNAYFSANVSADSFTDRTPFYEGDALSEIMKIKGIDGEIDHLSLPNFVRVEKKEKLKDKEGKEIEIIKHERDLGAMISMLTVGMQQITERLNKIEVK